MRILPWFGWIVIFSAISLALASTAEARHFWQTYGATVPSVDGCTWNVNSDYFVPRHASSCRYGLYSPCKTSCSTSPACKWCHPIYSGYCSPYGSCHYRRRNHVYSCRCGCKPIAVCLQRCRSNKACSCAAAGASAISCTLPGCVGPICSLMSNYGSACESGICYEPVAPLHNVEPEGFHSLGSIPVDSSELLTRADLSQLGADGGQLLLPPREAKEQLPLQNLNLPQFTQPNLDQD